MAISGSQMACPGLLFFLKDCILCNHIPRLGGRTKRLKIAGLLLKEIKGRINRQLTILSLWFHKLRKTRMCIPMHFNSQLAIPI
jgi:hypothetical protein